MWANLKELGRNLMRLIFYVGLAWAMVLFLRDPHPATKDYFTLAIGMVWALIDAIETAVKEAADKFGVYVYQSVETDGQVVKINNNRPK